MKTKFLAILLFAVAAIAAPVDLAGQPQQYCGYDNPISASMPGDSMYFCGVMATAPDVTGWFQVNGIADLQGNGKFYPVVGEFFADTTSDGFRGLILWDLNDSVRVTQIRGDRGAVYVANQMRDSTGADYPFGIALIPDETQPGNATIGISAGTSMLLIEAHDLDNIRDDEITITTYGRIKIRKRRLSEGIPTPIDDNDQIILE